MSFYIVIQKKRKFFNGKNVKIGKQADALKGYASSCNVEILLTLSYNLKILNLQLKIN